MGNPVYVRNVLKKKKLNKIDLWIHLRLRIHINVDKVMVSEVYEH